jgi:hypothetical protein
MSGVPVCRTATGIRHAALSLVVVAVVAAGGPPANAAPGWAIDVGLAGAFRAGSWTPLRLMPPADADAMAGDRVFVWAQDPDGEFVRAPAASLRPTAGGGLEAHTCVRVGRPTARVFIERVPQASGDVGLVPVAPPEGAIEMLLAEPIPSTHRVLVVLGDLPAAGRAARLMTAPDAPPLTVVAPLGRGPIAAGISPRDYDLADVMLVCGRSLKDVPAEVITGIDAWVRDGGRLVLCAGASAVDMAGAGGPAAAWLPGPVERLVPVRRVAAIEAYARAGGLAARPGASALRVPLLRDRRSLPGAVDVFEGTGPTDMPLVVRTARGLGTVCWVGLDLDDDPLRGWTGTDSLLVRLLGGRADDTDLSVAAREPGAVDLAGQLRTALERTGGRRAPPIATVPFEVITGLGLLYVLTLYPLDWWIASRGRPWLAWLTLPAFVVLFSAAAWGVADRRRPAVATVARAAEVIDVDVEGQRVRSHGWAAVWSDANAAYDVAVGDGAGEEATVSWFADAGTGFGGIDAAVPHPMLAAAPYRYGRTLATLDGVPMAAASNRLFEAAWQRSTADGPILVTSNLSRDAQGTLRGSFTHHLPFPIEDCRLAHGGWVYDIGTLPPDVTFDLRTSRGPRSLAGALQRRGAVDDRDLPNRWNRVEPDVFRILEVAGLHAAAGGAAYTLMPGGRLTGLDRTGLLSVDRAVLVGATGDMPAGWSIPWRLAPRGSADVAEPIETIARICRLVVPLGPVGGSP